MASGVSWRVAVPAVATAVVGSGAAIVINLATEWKSSVWAWMAVAVLTMLAAGLSLWLARGSSTVAAPGVSQTGLVGRDNIQIGQVGGDARVDRGK